MGLRGPKPGTGGRPKNSVPWSDAHPWVEFREVDPDCPLAKYEQQIRDVLFLHLGDEPSAPEKLIVKQAAKMAVISRLLGERLLGPNREITIESTAMYGSWSNMLLRYLQAIGIKKPAQQAATLEQYLTKRKVKAKPAKMVPIAARISSIRPQYPEPRVKVVG
jgi:hypothetical protein